MPTETFELLPKASISLALQRAVPTAERAQSGVARAAGVGSVPPTDSPQTAVIVEGSDIGGIADQLGNGVEVDRLSESFLSVRGDVERLVPLTRDPRVRRVQTKKQSQSDLDAALPDIGLVVPAAGPRPVPEDGTGVLIGIVDSGFDLSHPMFRDAAGRLRVEGLLDQSGDQPVEFTTDRLEQGWQNGRGPGFDFNGHGTHVTSIAAGSRFATLEGVAPGARLLLVKTNFRDTDKAVSWIFQQAGPQPCVVNMSLGHHFGAHDGTDAEERLHTQLSGPGKIIVISAGNERDDRIHLGGRFHAGQVEEVVFDLQRQGDGTAFAALTLWHGSNDQFTVSLVTPSGAVVAEAPLGNAVRQTFGAISVNVGQQRYIQLPSDLVQHQIALDVKATAPQSALSGWRVRISCQAAVIGRLDAWFNNSGFATFRQHDLVETARTVGLSATGAGCLAVASHVSRSTWQSDSGPLQLPTAVPGRSSTFSSMGPTRDGRQKPDLTAPGEMVTAALALGSEEAADDRAALTANRTLTIRGTSMAAPVVTGAVALMLQQKPGRTLADVHDLLSRSVRRDAHTGPGPWDPAYGLGKLDIVQALSL